MLRDNRNVEQAETIALQGLAYLASDPEILEVFLHNSGLGLDELKAKAGERDLLRAVMEFILASDEHVTTLCRDLDLSPRDLHLANHTLEKP
ncbi:hypothetical protein FHS83_003531 [Rhizomicrobium palustre]|jgi:hypothetical protein|uniref:DUF3572 domain-containing protein n=1 Tax=Rhizomicrobium palustre TaxID=189966 RepID=A0A846N3M9_9PROT|nr:DUF3572 family protein [Rhizomicrobium palustre]NIK90213.1 hypothetical protein [Rhizomicrobium palustre]